MDEIYHQALKLLRRRDYSVAQLREKLEARYGEIPQETIEALLQKRFLDDTRFASNHIVKRSEFHPSLVREELTRFGVSPEIVEQLISSNDWPSLRAVIQTKMNDRKLQAPIHPREAARLFRALARLGYPEDEIREELEPFHEQ